MCNWRSSLAPTKSLWEGCLGGTALHPWSALTKSLEYYRQMCSKINKVKSSEEQHRTQLQHSMLRVCPSVACFSNWNDPIYMILSCPRKKGGERSKDPLVSLVRSWSLLIVFLKPSVLHSPCFIFLFMESVCAPSLLLPPGKLLQQRSVVLKLQVYQQRMTCRSKVHDKLKSTSL